MPEYVRNLTVTINNPTDNDISGLNALYPDKAQYILAARELGENLTPHLQCYIQFKKQIRFTTAAKLLPRAHLIPSNGSAAQNITYCKKGMQSKVEYDTLGEQGDNYGAELDIAIEIGTPKQPGKRTDIEEAATDVMSGQKRLREIAEDHPDVFVKYCKGITSLYHATMPVRSADSPKEVIVHYGPTGTGKTRKCYDLQAHIQGPEQGKWWDGYDRHSTIIMDEFRGTLPLGYILRLTDRYPMQVEIKGGMTQLVANTIHFTSPVHPAYWYSSTTYVDGKIDQLKRRITQIYRHFDNEMDPIDETDLEWPTPDLSQFLD